MSQDPGEQGLYLHFLLQPMPGLGGRTGSSLWPGCQEGLGIP